MTEGFGSARSQVGTTYGGSDSNWVKENQNTILAIVGGILFVSGIYMMWPAAAPSDYDANSIDARLGNIPGYDPSRTSQDLDSSDEEGEAPTSFIANIPKKDSQVPAAPPAQFVESSSVSAAGLSIARKSRVVQVHSERCAVWFKCAYDELWVSRRCFNGLPNPTTMLHARKWFSCSHSVLRKRCQSSYLRSRSCLLLLLQYYLSSTFSPLGPRHYVPASSILLPSSCYLLPDP